MWPFRKKKKNTKPDISGAHKELLDALAPWRATHARSAWRPLATSSDQGQFKSQFGGSPLIEPGQLSPICPYCGKSPSLFLQLDSRELPESHRTFGDGILQLFYCRQCEVEGEGWNAFSAVSHFRILRSSRLERAMTNPGSELALRTIVGWEAFQDYPGTDEMEELGVTLQYDFDNDLVSVECKQIGLSMKGLPNQIEGLDLEVAEAISKAACGDKLGGWPHWIQSPEYPSCDQCGSIMEFFFQIDSEDNLNYMFGDVGCAHITQCPQHRDRFAFAWACC